MPTKNRVSYLQVAEILHVVEEFVDTSTEDHAVRVQNIVTLLAKDLKITGDDLAYLRVGASLHDIGKLAISASIFTQPSKLTRAQRVAVEKHPEFGIEIVKPANFPKSVLDCILCHQEHWDGSGYPHRLKGQAIPLNGRILCMADVWEAITAYRPYRKHMTRQEAIRFMHRHKVWFDPDLYNLWHNLIRKGWL